MARMQSILMIEDDARLASMVSDYLQANGYTVTHAPDAQSGLNQLTNNTVDLVILDLMLPDMDGLQVCRQLRKLYQPWTVPVLMLTALDQPIDRLRGFAHGADAYLTKPFDAEELLRTVRLLLSEMTLSQSE